MIIIVQQIHNWETYNKVEKLRKERDILRRFEDKYLRSEREKMECVRICGT